MIYVFKALNEILRIKVDGDKKLYISSRTSNHNFTKIENQFITTEQQKMVAEIYKQISSMNDEQMKAYIIKEMVGQGLTYVGMKDESTSV